MSNVLRIIIMTMLGFALGYSAIAFIELSFYGSEWQKGERALVVFIAALFGFITWTFE